MDIKQPDKLDVVFSISGDYAMPFCVALTSLLETNRELIGQVYLLYDTIEDKDRQRLDSHFSERYARTLHYVHMDASRVAGFHISGHIGIGTYFRLFLAEVLPPQQRRILYLDSDLVVCGGLGELQDFCVFEDDVVVYAVPECWGPDYRRQRYPILGLDNNKDYFNSGVLCCDVEVWRKEKIVDEFVATVNRLGSGLESHDQDVLNVVFAGRWQALHRKYNVYAAIADGGCKIDFAQTSEAQADPRIVHYTGRRKPWLQGCKNPYRDVWWQYLALTPWSDYQCKKVGFGTKLNNALPNSVKHRLLRLVRHFK